MRRSPFWRAAVAGAALLVQPLTSGPAEAAAGGRVLAWGANNQYQLGNGDLGGFDKSTPVAVTLAADNGATTVAAGGDHTLAIRSDGSVVAWGSNLAGELGDGHPFVNQVNPVAVSGLGPGSGAVAVAAGVQHSLALLADGRVLAWGSDDHGQLGDGGIANTNRSTPVAVTGLGAGSGVVAVAAGLRHSLAVRSDGSVLAWGSNENGQLGNGNAGFSGSQESAPVAVSGLGPGSGVKALAAGFRHSMALVSDGRVLAWGGDDRGQLGDDDPSRADKPTPVAVSGLGTSSGAVAVGAGSAHSLALRSDGSVLAWGANDSGQLGNGDPALADTSAPGPVTDLGAGSGVVALAAGFAHSLAARSDGSVLAWGSDRNGQLGDGGANVDQTTPVAVTGLGVGSGVVAVTAGYAHSLALKDPFAKSAPSFTAASPPAAGAVATPYGPYTFAASGDPVPTFAVASGALPPGLSLNPTTGVLSGTPTAGGPFTFTVRAANGISPDAVTATITITVAGTRFVPVSPFRVWDSRFGPGPLGPTIGGRTRNVTVGGIGGVPATGVTAVVLNLTAINPSAATYVTAWPAGEPEPVASNLNVPPGDVRPNLVIVKLGADGQVSVKNAPDGGSVDLIADVAGYFRAGTGSVLTSLTPGRVWDTRPGTGQTGPAGPSGAGQTRDLTVTGVGGVPATGVTAVVLNVTAVAPSAATYVTAWPTGEAKPLASNLNVPAGDVRANLVIVKVGAGGKVSFNNAAGSVDLIADVAGFYGAAGAGFTSVSPARVWDSRSAPGPAGQVGPGQTRDLTVTGVGGVPAAGVTAVVLNLTGITPSAATYVTAWPAGEVEPVASNLNLPAGDVRANLIVVKVGAGGKVSVGNAAGALDFAADVAGYFGTPGA